MGTLFNQPNRWEYVKFSSLDDLETQVRFLKEIATDSQVDYKDVLATYNAMDARTLISAQVNDWDVKDEQLAGFGKIAKQFCAAMAAYAKGDKDVLADLACDLGSIEEQLQGLMSDPCKYPTEPPEYKGQ